MAKVFLRVYNREIESMIEGGQLDEAVAHCQHILKTFPMHVETYRLLGKAFLEARRYADAADIFQRVLMSVPDDFVSHVGMSIIRDDEKQLDDAIWHMERAFEVQPSNSAIQGELRRLYGRRDGAEPAKIRLSRDALAFMYSQGELFNQAIAEIRSILAEDTNRPDLQVMLARAYYRSGQKVESAEMAVVLLKKYPYCMDALRILVDVLPGTARAENMQVYSERLHMLDPYSTFSSNSVFASDQVVDSYVNLERLEYRTSPAPASSQSDWASSLGIKLIDEKRAETPPNWMQTAETPVQPTALTHDASGPVAAAAAVAAVEGVPDWIRSAGWQESASAVKAGSTDPAETLPVEPIVKADIPDWLKSMAPPEVTERANPEPDEFSGPLPVGGDGIPDWLKSIGSTEAAGEVHLESQKPVEPMSEGDDDIPDWLKSIAPAETAGETHIEAQLPVESQQVGEDATPEWLKSSAQAGVPKDVTTEPQMPFEPQLKPQESVEPLSVSGDEVTDWFKSIAPEEGVGEMHVEPQEQVEPQPANGDGVPDWLKSMESEPEPPTSGIPTANAGAFPDWLMGMDAHAEASAFNAKEGEQSATGEEPVSESLVPPEPAIQEAAKPPVAASGTTSESLQPMGEVKPLNLEDETLGWLESLAAKQGAKPEELLTNPQERSEEIPDWLRQSIEPQVGAPAPSAQEPIRTTDETLSIEPLTRLTEASDSKPAQTIDEAFPVQEETPSSKPPAEAVAQPAIQPTNTEDDTIAWLEQLAVNQETRPDESSVSPINNLGATPDLIQKVKDDQLAVPAPEELIPAKPDSMAEEGDDTITSWLSKMDVEEAIGKKSSELPGETQPAAPVEELPDWLKDLEKPSPPIEALKTDNELPEWLRQPISATEPEPVTPTPGLASAPDLEMPTWEDENASVTGQASPTIAEEWIPVESREPAIPDSTPATESTMVTENPPVVESVPVPQTTQAVETAAVSEPEPSTESTPIAEPIPVTETLPVIEPEPDTKPASFAVQTPVQLPTLKQTGMLSPIPAQDKDAELLSNAQTVLDQNSLDDSMKQYIKLIKKGRLLDEVIHDLREAIYRYPVDVIIWQTLGDAYMRANRLQDALDAYTKAEELLR